MLDCKMNFGATALELLDSFPLKVRCILYFWSGLCIIFSIKVQNLFSWSREKNMGFGTPELETFGIILVAGVNWGKK